MSSTQLELWDELYQAVEGVTESSYIVALSVFGMVADFYPTAELATWLKGSGASLTAWREFTAVYCSDNYNCNYVFVGQEGLEPGQGFEKFVADYVATRTPPSAGDFFANVSIGLAPPITADGPFTLPVLPAAAVGAPGR